MRIIDRRCGWHVDGAYIDTLPANLTVTEDQMRAYFGITEGGSRYEEHVRSVLYDRIVLQRPNGEFVIVPINPDVYMTEA